MAENSNVDHPSHYQTSRGLETIDVMEAFTENLSGIEAICTSNVLKYICRWKQKNGLEDLKKAEWYLKRLIEHVECADNTAEVLQILQIPFGDCTPVSNTIKPGQHIK